MNRQTMSCVIVVEVAVPIDARMSSGVPIRRTGFLPSEEYCDGHQCVDGEQ